MCAHACDVADEPTCQVDHIAAQVSQCPGAALLVEAPLIGVRTEEAMRQMKVRGVGGPEVALLDQLVQVAVME